jgi:transposase
MGYNFQPYQQDQVLLLPPSLDEWVAEDSMARFINDIVEHMESHGELADFYAHYRPDGWGAAAFHPLLMLKVLLYCYCNGVTSSRKIRAGLENDVAVRYLSANQQPDFRTIALFRRRHLEALDGLFVKVLALCREMGMVELGRVALDGRKVPGGAALDQNRTLEGIEREVAGLLAKAEEDDRAEDARFGEDSRGDELPEALRRKGSRLERLREAQRQLEEKAKKQRETQQNKIDQRSEEEKKSGRKKRGRKPRAPQEVVNDEAKANVTDPDSRILKTRSHGHIQGYNGQAMADCASQVIVAQSLTQEQNDQHQLAPMLEACAQQAGAPPQQVLADAGYANDENLALQTETTELFVATQKDYKQRCAMRETPAPDESIPPNATPRQRMEHKLQTEQGRQAYRQRASTIEPVFGQMVTSGLVRFCLRGFEKVRAEWSLWCTTHNLKKLWRAGWSATQSIRRTAQSSAWATG